MPTEDRMVSYYAGRAREYERIYEKPERQANLRWLREFVERTFIGAHVLEVACGTGYWTEVIARSAASVLATDINDEVLSVARGKELDLRKVDFCLADAYALPAFPRRFTAGFSAFWWSHIRKARLQDFLQGFHRSLPPGARVVLIDNVYVEGSSTPISHTDAYGDTYQIRQLENGTRHEVVKNFPTPAELEAAVRDSAADVQTVFLQYYWVLSYLTKGDA